MQRVLRLTFSFSPKSRIPDPRTPQPGILRLRLCRLTTQAQERWLGVWQWTRAVPRPQKGVELENEKSAAAGLQHQPHYPQPRPTHPRARHPAPVRFCGKNRRRSIGWGWGWGWG